eukprot:scaffold3630_cov306-Prasinococcus_capsulatus_cf.AAC.1
MPPCIQYVAPSFWAFKDGESRLADLRCAGGGPRAVHPALRAAGAAAVQHHGDLRGAPVGGGGADAAGLPAQGPDGRRRAARQPRLGERGGGRARVAVGEVREAAVQARGALAQQPRAHRSAAARLAPGRGKAPAAAHVRRGSPHHPPPRRRRHPQDAAVRGARRARGGGGDQAAPGRAQAAAGPAQPRPGLHLRQQRQPAAQPAQHPRRERGEVSGAAHARPLCL